MWPYVITFGISCLFAGIADRCHKSRKKKWFVFYSILALLAGAVLAGLRADNVGTDVRVYGNSIFLAACMAKNPIDYIVHYQAIADIEPLYLALNYVVSRFTTDTHWFYFTLQSLTLFFVYGALLDQKKALNIDLWLGLFTYYTLFYSFSLNGMRQALAMSVVLWAMKYLYRKDLRRFTVSVIIAAGFHYSAILCIFLYPTYIFIQMSRRKEVAILTMVGAFCLIGFCNQLIIQFLASWIPKYNRYLGGEIDSISINPLLLRAPFIIWYCIFYYRYKYRNANTDFWITLLFADAILSVLRGFLPALYRTSLYFGLVKIYAYPYIPALIKENSKHLMKILLTLILSIIWYYQVVYQGNDAVYPYMSDVLSWLN